MVTITKEPILNPESKKILEKLRSHGWNISWAVNTDLGGSAASDIKEQRVYFRDEASSQNQEPIFHELSHFDLYDKEYPMIRAREAWNGGAIYMLNDVFQHLAMKPQVEGAGFSFATTEAPAALRLINSLNNGTPTYNEPYWSALYIRGHFLEIESSKMALLEKYIRSTHTSSTFDKVEKAISELPIEGCSIEQYEASLGMVLSTLGQNNAVIFDRK